MTLEQQIKALQDDNSSLRLLYAKEKQRADRLQKSIQKIAELARDEQTMLMRGAATQ